jgi:hypothetical protein
MGAQGQLTQGGMMTAQQLANNITGAGAANAGGTVGASNAIGAGLAGVGGAANQYIQNLMLQQMLANRR